jgi:hypothetical protein
MIKARIDLLVFPTRVINVATAVITAKGNDKMKAFTIDAENNITLHATAQEADAVANAERFSTSAALAKLAEKWPVARLVEIWNSLPGASPVKKFTDRKTAVTRIWKAIQSLGVVVPTTGAEAPAVAPEAIAQPETAPENIETPVTIEPETPAAELPDHEAAAGITVADPQVEPEEITIEAEPSVEPAEAAAETDAPESETVADVSAQAPDVAPETPAATKKATRAKKTPQTPTGEPKAPRDGSKTSQLIAMLKREGGATLEEIMSTMGWLQHTTRAMLSAGGSLAKKHGLVVMSEKVGDKRTYSIKA